MTGPTRKHTDAPMRFVPEENRVCSSQPERVSTDHCYFAVLADISTWLVRDMMEVFRAVLSVSGCSGACECFRQVGRRAIRKWGALYTVVEVQL